MSIYSVNILSVCLSAMLQKALLLMNVVIIVLLINQFLYVFSSPILLNSKQFIVWIPTQVISNRSNLFLQRALTLWGSIPMGSIPMGFYSYGVLSLWSSIPMGLCWLLFNLNWSNKKFFFCKKSICSPDALTVKD